MNPVAASVSVQYGCGHTAPIQWMNFDASPTLRLQRLPLLGRLTSVGNPPFPDNVRYGDIVRGLPLNDSTVDIIYCSHVLEHLTRADCMSALRATHRLLKPGGTFRLVLPDLQALVQAYVEDPDSARADTFMRASYLGQESRRDLMQRLRDGLGNSRHQWMWDGPSMLNALCDVGFTACRVAQFGDSSNELFKLVESPERWHGSIGFEATRPEAESL